MKRNVKPQFDPRSTQKKKRKAISLVTGLLTAFMITGMMAPTAAFAANASSLAASYVSSNYTTDNVQIGSSFRIYLNGANVTEQFADETAIRVTDEGRTLLPLRALGNLLGASVDWDSTNKVAILTISGKTIEVPIGSTMLIVDGTASQIDSEGTQAIIVGDGYTYLPFRAVAEACGATVDYQTGSDGSKNIYLTTSGSTSEITPTTPTEVVSSDPALAAIGIYNATDLGFSTSNMPSPGEDYYDSINNYVSIGRASGLTDEQIDANLQYVYPCKANGDGSGTATTAQEEHYITVCSTATAVNEPSWKGEYKYQQYYGYQWNGSSWTLAAGDMAGISGLGISMS
ncbi:MAG: copper amine oxidase N-terminal domain-containing protein [Clostridiales bacterium]|nr:copper amine oxidase N-terminal domain-containing protein [Clostridiales bacterium]